MRDALHLLARALLHAVADASLRAENAELRAKLDVSETIDAVRARELAAMRTRRVWS